MNDEQLLPIGTILQGRYRIERQLASGGETSSDKPEVHFLGVETREV